MRKFLSLLFLLAFFIPSLHAQQNGAHGIVVVDGLRYSYSYEQQTKRASLLGYESTDPDDYTFPEVNILESISDEEGNSYPVTSIYGLGDNRFIEKVIIPNSVRNIGFKCFYNCSNLKEIDFGDNIEEIADEAFSYCTSLARANLPVSVTSLGLGAFSGCDALTSVALQNTKLTSISPSTFRDCVSLTSVMFPPTLTVIGESAFKGATLLQAVSTNLGLLEIDNNAFEDCISLSLIAIPPTVTRIGQYAFMKSGVEEIEITDNSITIEEAAFQDCQNLKQLIIDNAECIIRTEAFYNCTALKYCRLNDIKSLGWSAFAYCSSLEVVDMSGSSIEDLDIVFYDCISLKEVILPENLKELNRTFIGSGAPIEKMDFPKSLESINNAFENSKIKELTIPSNVTFISQSCFSSSTIESINIEANIEYIYESTFENCSNLQKVKLPATLKVIGRKAFAGTSSLEAIEFPEGFERIGELAFQESGLREVSIPANCYLEWRLFYNCPSLETIKFEGPVDCQQADIFEGCQAVRYIDFADDMETLPNILKYCPLVESIIVPKAMTYLPQESFSGNGLKYVAIPERDNCQIESDCFLNSPLEEITMGNCNYYLGKNCFPATMKKIEILADELPSIDYEGDPTAYVNKQTCQLIVPEQLLPVYQVTFPWSEFFNISAAGIETINSGDNQFDANLNITVYDMTGKIVYTGLQSDMSLPSGCYIMKQGVSIRKVIL